MRLLVFLFCLVVNIVKPEELYEEVETQCIKNCPLQNRTDKGHYGYACDYNCHIEQCNRGCSLWREALDRTCQEACSSTPGDTPTQPQVYLYCSTGCNAAVAAYFQLLRLKLGTPPAPALLADSLGSTSLWLEWRSRREAGRWAGLTARVQWQYEELEGGWRYADRAEWDDEREAFLVAGLKPYTKYRFRIALLLGSAPVSPTTNATTAPSMSPPPLRLHNHAFLEPILSGESHVISTLAEGPPAAPPRNVRAAPVAPTSIGLAWEAGPFPNGPLLSYVLHITDDKHEEVINKVHKSVLSDSFLPLLKLYAYC